MKFAQFLQDTQVPEWKKAYIDYRGLKKQIRVIKLEQGGTPSPVIDIKRNPNQHRTGCETSGNESPEVVELEIDIVPGVITPPAEVHLCPENSISLRKCSSTCNPYNTRLDVSGVTKTPPGVVCGKAGTKSGIDSSSSPSLFQTLSEGNLCIQNPSTVGDPLLSPLHHLRHRLPPAQAEFFVLLDADLEKVDSFYRKQEKELRERGNSLRAQLDSLLAHRQGVYEPQQRKGPRELCRSGRSTRNNQNKSPDLGTVKIASDSSLEDAPELMHLTSSAMEDQKLKTHSDIVSFGRMTPSDVSANGPRYRNAKRQLRKAITEYYRGLEVLDNYRILNLNGFCKALKKFEKVTLLPASSVYMEEKVNHSTIASGANVAQMLREAEDFYAEGFARGNKTVAMQRLRLEPSTKTHHQSTFRSGVYLGLSVSALASVIYQCSQASSRDKLPSWKVLLYVYSILGMPAILALLVGVNIHVWVRERINYPFIFEVDMRTRIDPHKYFELPSLMLCLLSNAFLFSFSHMGPPFAWPLVWILGAFAIMFNPIKCFVSRSSRWWTIKNLAKLGLSGILPVDFASFWFGDMLCSLSFTLGNLAFIGCVYTHCFQNDLPSQVVMSIPEKLSTCGYDPEIQQVWQTCTTSYNWVIHCVLTALPNVMRLLQCLKRHWDTGCPANILNAGKYSLGILYSFCYSYWTYQGTQRHGTSFFLFCSAACIYSFYACAWDFLADWSLLKSHAYYPLLRADLVYATHVESYYFAMVTNLLIRFIWVIYIPVSGPNFTVRTVIAAFLEVLRRVQWNFYRLEAEHLGNVDQYRVTRDIPLPYPSLLQQGMDDDDYDYDLDDANGNENGQIKPGHVRSCCGDSQLL